MVTGCLYSSVVCICTGIMKWLKQCTSQTVYVLDILPCVGIGAVMCPDSFVDFFCSVLHKLFACFLGFLTSVFSYLSTSLHIFLKTGPFLFQAGDRKRRQNLALVFVFTLCWSTVCYLCVFAFVVFDLVFSVPYQEIVCWAERPWNNIFGIGWT